MEEVPVYLFLGFLDSGKTRFVQQTLEDTEFNGGERTLLLLCEQGEEEYDPAYFANPDVELVAIAEEEELTPDALAELERQTKPERVIVEYNGMWQLRSFIESMPKHWTVYQCMLFADSASFPVYDQNMRPLTGDKLTYADTVIFNRFSEKTDREQLHRIVRSVSRKASILYEYPDGRTEQDNIPDPLPYDIEQPIITIRDEDYAVFYRDILDDPLKYQGKVLKFRAETTRSNELPPNQAALGRFVMTCCVQDITFCGFIADWGQGQPPQFDSWILAGARVAVEHNPVYGKVGPVLYILAAKPARKPKQEVATFY